MTATPGLFRASGLPCSARTGPTYETSPSRPPLLHPALLPGRAELVPRVPRRQPVGVGRLPGHVQREPRQHGITRVVPVRPDLVLRRVVRLVVELLGRLPGELRRLALDLHAG